MGAITAAANGAVEDEDAIKRRKLLQEALELDKDDDDDEGRDGDAQKQMQTDGDEEEEESEEESEEEDDTDELLRELEKIKRERAEEKARQEREQLASQAAQLGTPGLNTTVPGTFAVKKRWDDGACRVAVSDKECDRAIIDIIFKNQAMNQKEKSGHFVNDLLRTEFHKWVPVLSEDYSPDCLPSENSWQSLSRYVSHFQTCRWIEQVFFFAVNRRHYLVQVAWYSV